MKNLATVLLCGPPASAVGGGPTHIRNLLASPLRLRYRFVHFECGSRGKESPAKDEPSLAKAFRLLTSPFALTYDLIRFRPAVVHINSALDNKAFWRDSLYLMISKAFARKVVFQLHGGSLALLCSNSMARGLVRWLFSLPDAVVLLATAELMDFDEQIGKRDRLSIIANAVDIGEYQYPPERLHSGRALRLGFLGRLVRTKGVFESIGAVEILRAQPAFRDVTLEIAGSGPEAEAISKYIVDRGLSQFVRMIGPLTGKAKVEFLLQIDVLLFPTFHLEGLPYTILESLASGTPVVATRVGGIPDVVTNGIHGVLIASHDAAEAARGVRVLAESTTKLQQMSKDCLSWARQQLGFDRLAREFDDVYQRVSEPKQRAQK